MYFGGGGGGERNQIKCFEKLNIYLGDKIFLHVYEGRKIFLLVIFTENKPNVDYEQRERGK